MRVAIERVIQTAPYETIRLIVEVNEGDLPEVESSSRDKLRAMHYMAYRETVIWEVSQDHKTKTEARNDLANLTRTWNEADKSDNI